VIDVRDDDLTRPTVRRRGIWALGLALAAAVALTLPPAAGAKTEAVNGGTTSFKISSEVGEFLADTGTKVKAIEPGKATKKGFALPITRGKLDTKKVKGSLKHDGSLSMKGDGGKAEVTKFQAKFGKGSKIKAKVDGENTALFELDTENAKAKESDGTIKISRVNVLLTSKGVSLFEEVADMELEDRDVVFGKLKVRAEAGGGEFSLTGGDTGLALDDAAKSKFTAQGIATSAVDPATKSGDSFSFPVVGGKVAADGASGEVRLDGGLRLAKAGTNLDLTKLRIHVEDGEITAVAGGSRKTVMSFNANKVEPTIQGDNVTLSGIAAKLTEDGAAAINDAFGGNAFAVGDAIGAFEVEATSSGAPEEK
jgi:hypothetical protein